MGGADRCLATRSVVMTAGYGTADGRHDTTVRRQLVMAEEGRIVIRCKRRTMAGSTGALAVYGMKLGITIDC